MIRVAPPRPRRTNLLRTAGQTAFMWGTFLFVMPWVIRQVERHTALPTVRRRPRTGALIFGAMSLLGLFSGATMALTGEGTPFPTDTARRLVLRGPYRHVRNPMALAGLGQGVGIALLTGSPLTLAYVLLGGLLWNAVARPLEERDLQARFGAPYARYRRAVRCWWPRLTPYHDSEG